MQSHSWKKFTIGNAAYHDHTMVSDLPKDHNTISQQWIWHQIGSKWYNRSSAKFHWLCKSRGKKSDHEVIRHLDIHIKHTGDRTQIVGGLAIVNIAFTILEDQTTSVLEWLLLGYLQNSWNYVNLAVALKDICKKENSQKSTSKLRNWNVPRQRLEVPFDGLWYRCCQLWTCLHLLQMPREHEQGVVYNWYHWGDGQICI